uniref:Uncharacterized protein n=1 Tax=candidate division WOR-3 bacterium TaxID=2052148 RepID=A0A7V3ZWC8_UNCW3
MFRKPVYLSIFLIIFGLFCYLEYMAIERKILKIEQMEKDLLNQLREFTTYKNYVYQFSLPPSRSFLFIDMRELGDYERKASFLKDYFQNFAKNYGLNAEAEVRNSQHFDWMNVLSVGGVLKVYRVSMEIQNYTSLPALLDFLNFLKNFPIIFESFEAGTGGEKKGYMKLTFHFIETYEE